MRNLNIAIIHARLHCIDGVSVEADKWATVYNRLGHNVFSIAGKLCKKPRTNYLEIPEAYHLNPKINQLRDKACSSDLSDIEKEKIVKKIDYYSNIIKPKIKNFIIKNKIDLLSVENIFSLPINIPFTIAVTDIINELNLPCIARHHDFYWEREEYLKYEANFKDIFEEFFPPKLKNITHVVINKAARDSLKKRKEINSVVIYNKFNFSDICKKSNRNLKKEFHIGNDEIIFLQPTKIIRRKKIRRSIELVSSFKKRFNKKCVLVVTGPADFSNRYYQELRKLAEKLGVKMLAIHKDLDPERKKIDSSKIHSIWEIYPPSDIVTFPSDLEGFGDPVIESAMYKKPLVVNRYPVLNEILDYGFKFIVMNKKVTSKILDDAYKVIVNKNYAKKTAERNFKIAHKYFSLNSLKNELRFLIKKTIKNKAIQDPKIFYPKIRFKEKIFNIGYMVFLTLLIFFIRIQTSKIFKLIEKPPL